MNQRKLYKNRSKNRKSFLRMAFQNCRYLRIPPHKRTLTRDDVKELLPSNVLFIPNEAKLQAPYFEITHFGPKLCMLFAIFT